MKRHVFSISLAILFAACGAEPRVGERPDALALAAEAEDKAAADVAAFFDRESVELPIARAPNVEDEPVAIRLSENVALSLINLDEVRGLRGGDVLQVQPRTFIGGALTWEDLRGEAPVFVGAGAVASVIHDLEKYRTFCGFVDQYGGSVVRGTVNVRRGGATYEIVAEVSVSSTTLAAAPAGAVCTDQLCVSLPDKHCRDTAQLQGGGRCLAVACGFTAGDAVGAAAGSQIPVVGGLVGGTVGGLTDKITGTAYIAKGKCGEVTFAWFIPVGCQCVFL